MKMDRLRRFVALIRVQWRVLKNRLWYNEPEGDNFRFVDVFSAFGGIHYEPGKRWQKICWLVYRRLGYLLCVLFLATAVDPMKFDVITVSWFIAACVVFTSGYMKEFILHRSFASIQNIRCFISSRSNASNDPHHDALERRNFFQTTQIASLGLMTVIALCALVSPILALLRHRFFVLPSFVCPSNSIISGTLNTFYLMALFIHTVSKLFAPIIQTTTLTAGLCSELKIFTNEFYHFLQQVQVDVQQQSEQAFWENLNQMVKYFVEKHNEHLEHLRQLGDLIKAGFFVCYYHDVICIGSLLFIVVKEGFSSGNIIIVMGIGSFLAECYWWCRLAEFFTDINETMEQHITDLMVKIPHSKAHHSDYVQLRSALMIMMINTQNSGKFNCFGLFDISVEVFTHLLNISYSLYTFLLEVELSDAYCTEGVMIG